MADPDDPGWIDGRMVADAALDSAEPVEVGGWTPPTPQAAALRRDLGDPPHEGDAEALERVTVEPGHEVRTIDQARLLSASAESGIAFDSAEPVEDAPLRERPPSISADDVEAIRQEAARRLHPRVGDGDIPLGPLALDLLANPGKSIPELLSRTDNGGPEDSDDRPNVQNVDSVPAFGPGTGNVWPPTAPTPFEIQPQPGMRQAATPATGDDEIDAMSIVRTVLDSLEDRAVRRRVVAWIQERYR